MLYRIDIDNIPTERFLSSKWRYEILEAIYEMTGANGYLNTEIDFENVKRVDCSTYLDDGFYYSKIMLRLNAVRKGKFLPEGYLLEITPFTVELYPSYSSKEIIKYKDKLYKMNDNSNRMLTKYLRKFLIGIYGEEYDLRFKTYYQIVKNNKIRKFTEEIDENYEDLMK